MTREEIIKVIKPLPEEMSFFDAPDILAGLSWGKPRPGHPEGCVAFHVADVINNIEQLCSQPGKAKYRSYLRVIAILHDTYKYRVDQTKPKQGENHHAMIARRVAEREIGYTAVLDVIELHDDAYNAYQKGLRSGFDKAEERAKRIVERIGENMEMYLAFYWCDNSTGDKDRADYDWFTGYVRKNYPALMKFENGAR